MFFFPSALIACELTDEYKEARSYAYKASRQAYNECRDSVSKSKYWYKYIQCIEAGDGKNIGGGCSHIVGLSDKYKELNINDKFCSKLKPTSKEIKKWFLNRLNERNIKKCKQT